MLRRLLAATVLTAATIAVGAGAASAGVAGPCRVIKGEFQGAVSVSPPCELDVSMYIGNLGGVDVWHRCNNWGGIRLAYEGSYLVCYAVDY